MRELTLFGENTMNKEDVMVKIKDDTIGLATGAIGAKNGKILHDKIIEARLSKYDIYKLILHLYDFLMEDFADKYYLVSEDGKYLNIDSTEYIGFGEKESRYKNTFTDNEIDEYNLSHWIENGNVKKVLVKDTNEKKDYIWLKSLN